ncbi:MAG: hypothetical protein AAGC81_02410 [Pseudomonadota bacterium]
MPFPLLAIGAAVVGIVLGVMLAKKATPPPRQPEGFKRPKTTEGDSIIVIFGTVDIREPQVVDFGDTSVEPNYIDGGGKK